MARRRSPNVLPHPTTTELDDLAKLLAERFANPVAQPEDRQRIEAGRDLLKRRLRKHLGVPYYEADEPASAGIERFLKELAAKPGDQKIVTGALLWIVTKNAHIDSWRRRKASLEVSLDSEADVDPDPEADGRVASKGHGKLACPAAAARAEALNLHLHASSVLRRHGAKLDARMRRVLEVIQLVAASAPSAATVYKESAAILCAEGVLGKGATRNLRAMLDRRPDVRRHLSMPARLGKPAAGGSSSDE